MKKHEEIRRYQALNKLAAHNGTVIFGGARDCDIPVNELKQYFDLNETIYNRSISGLSVTEAAEAYTECVEKLVPDRVLLHIGAADAELVKSEPAVFDRGLMELVNAIRNGNTSCEIIIVSMKGDTMKELNRHLSNVADACRCTYMEINTAAFNPATTRETLSFLSSLGILRNRTRNTAPNSLVRILFNYESVLA